MKFKVGSCLVIATLMLAACTQKNNDNSLIGYAKNIVSTRAQNTKQFIAILKLKNPALMETAQKQNGRAVIDENLLKAITLEQQEAISELKKLSSDVQVVFTYKMVLNAIAILAPIELEDKIKNVGMVAYTESSGNFDRPITFQASGNSASSPFSDRNSSKFIGAQKLNEAGIKGQGMKVGIIDTGIDYTHAMLGGVGTAEAYRAINPAEQNDAFPNKKVVGGIDLVGTDFDSASADFKLHIPKPDLNPIDEAGHGTHVAGTVAGIGDGVNTYNGMAPDADLYAIKVFGARGSTSDCAVIAALEFSADPNNDGNNNDQLDVVNLSLGSSFGNPHILYSEAIKNLVNGGTLVVASAGNSGHIDYIVGAPGTSDKAISVAASVDNGDHLWRFNASKINLGSEKILVEALEAQTTRKIADSDVSGKLVFIGTAAQELSEQQKIAVRGNIALIDRGQISFNDKIKRAQEAGAIGVVVANNNPGAPIPMGTTDNFDIPAIMISLDAANKVKEAMKNLEVTFNFKTDEKIEKPELVDTLTDFSSKGPRSVDGFLKPEISAPGANVISAQMGSGNKGVQMSGTSMAAPHMAGVMALVKQAHKTLTTDELKSLIMGTSKTIGKNGDRYPVSQQGAGRVQADKAAESKLVVDQSALSLGEVAVEVKKVVRRYLEIKNISDEKLEFDLTFEGNGFISMARITNITVEAGKTVNVAVNLTLDTTSMGDEKIHEMDGWVKMMQGKLEIYRVPVLAVAHKLSSIAASNLIVKSTSEADSSGALSEVTLSAQNTNQGEVLLFNMIGGQDERKPKAAHFMSSDCDLQSAGYRIVTHKNSKNENEDFLQVAVKLYKPMTRWYSCDVSLLIDSNQDGVPEQELLGSSLNSIPGQQSSEFATTLIDAAKAREIRKAYEKAVEEAQDDDDMMAALRGGGNYNAALLDQSGMKVYNNSSVAIMQISTKNLALTTDGALSFKLLVTNNEQSAVEFDDYLKATVKTDMRISLKKSDQSFVDLPEMVKLSGSQNQKVEMTKGDGKESLLVLFPNNKFSMSDLHEDSQSQILTPVYKAE